MANWRKILKWFGITVISAAVIYAGLILYAIITFAGMFDEYHTLQELTDNFGEKEEQIYSARDYFRKILPPGMNVRIEFSEDGELEMFDVRNDGVYNHHSEHNTDSLLDSLKWSQVKLKTLHQKLSDANCISIESGTVCTIGFRRSGMGMLFYDLHAAPLSQKEKDKLNTDCAYIIHNDSVVFKYGGGAIGPQCFPEQLNEIRLEKEETDAIPSP